MIWALAREQVRSQWRYLLAAALVIAVTVAVAVYGALMSLTLIHSQREVDHFLGYDRDSVADASTEPGPAFVNLTHNVDDANVKGHEVVAVASVLPTLANAHGVYQYTTLTALHGDVDWSTMIVDGAAPKSGEIVVTAQWAAENHAAIGDDIHLVVDSTVAATDVVEIDTTLRVSGLSRSPVATAAVQMYVPDGYVAWDDVPGLNQAWEDAVNQNTDASGAVDVSVVGVTVSGNGNWPWNASLATMAGPSGGSSTPAGAIAIIAGIGVAALVIGLVAMAFALGRAQAQARTKWIGTVRALGATKRQIAAASLLESVAIGSAAGLAGIVIGGVAATAHLSVISVRVANPMILRPSAGYLAVALAAVALGVVLALIVGAVPAFWSSRVEPTAALKPINDLSEATASREVKTWPLVVVWLLSLAVTAYGALFGADGLATVPVVTATVSLVVTSLMLAHEVLRRTLPWRARGMTRSKHRAVMVAGDAILARPRQSTIPAFIVAVATAIVVGLFSQLVVAWAIENADVDEWGQLTPGPPNPYISPLILWGVFAVVTFLCVVIAAATASVSAREAATREALGLTRRESRAAAGIQYIVAQAHGLVLGLAGGMVVAAFLIPTGNSAAYDLVSLWWPEVALLLALTMAIAAVCALGGAAVVAALAPRTSPLSRVEVSA